MFRTVNRCPTRSRLLCAAVAAIVTLAAHEAAVHSASAGVLDYRTAVFNEASLIHYYNLDTNADDSKGTLNGTAVGSAVINGYGGIDNTGGSQIGATGGGVNLGDIFGPNTQAPSPCGSARTGAPAPLATTRPSSPCARQRLSAQLPHAQ